ncbi:MAG: DegT/DnrJ/EryC1/StrS family aminotransferase, partial [bacterium]
LHLALRVLDLEPGDEVIVPALTFVATSNAVLYNGLTPVFCDIESLETPVLSPEEIAWKITHNTRVIIPMHYAGYPCDIARLEMLQSRLQERPRRGSKKKDSIIVEDACHGVGGSYRGGRKMGSAGKLNCFSFFANKNLATGEGGLITTDDSALAGRLRQLRSHAMTSLTWERHSRGFKGYDVVDLGYNLRPNELACAIGIEQLKKLPEGNQRRRELTHRYRRLLKSVDEVLVPFKKVHPEVQPACHLMPALLKDKETRDKVRVHLAQRGIQTSHHYPVITHFSYYRDRLGSSIPNLPKSEEYSNRELTLPLHPRLSEDDVATVVEAIKEALVRT